MGSLQVQRRPSQSPQVGDMRERISIYKRTLTPPAFEEAAFEQTLELKATIWASMETSRLAAARGDKVFNQVNLSNESAYAFRCRYTKLEVTPDDPLQPDAQARDILLHKSLHYRIRSIENPDGRKRFLKINCTLLGTASVKVNK